VVDLAEIVRGEAARYLSTHTTTAAQRKALVAVAGCRTDAMGSVLETCVQCEVEYPVYRSCGNRNCPQCQGQTRMNWFASRIEDLLPTRYLHAVFKAPREIHKLAQYCPKPIYDAVISAAGQAVIDVGREELHVQLGCQTQFQTWTQKMARLLHTHCVIPCGGFSEDGRWMSFQPEQLPARALSRRFRILACRAIRRAAREGKLERLPDTVSVDQILARLMDREWKVYAKPPFGGPEQLLAYLARYINRVAITNDRIESYEEHQVTFRWCDYGDGCRVRPHKLDGQKFLELYLMHVLPEGFVRTRYYGFLANRNRKSNIERARQLIGSTDTPSAREQKPFQPLRLCPECSAARHGQPVPQPTQRRELAPALPFKLRPPPINPVAA
jgi:hypothetical protein